jgi:hypothetical protein
MVWVTVWVSGFSILAAQADIYSWTDENGVNHFTNYAPPKHARLLIKTPEIPYDQDADNQRQETDRLEVARHELAEREAFLLLQQQEAERRLAEANARADAALREADQILQDAEAAAENGDYYRNGSYAYGYGYYPYYRPGYRKYGHHYKKRHHKYRHGRHYKYKYRHGRPYKPGYRNGHKYYSKSHHRQNGFKRHRSISRGGKFSHHSRAAAFRGRHGRY